MDLRVTEDIIASTDYMQKGIIIMNIAFGKNIEHLMLLIIFASVRRIIIPAIIVTLICTMDAGSNSIF